MVRDKAAQLDASLAGLKMTLTEERARCILGGDPSLSSFAVVVSQQKGSTRLRGDAGRGIYGSLINSAET